MKLIRQLTIVSLFCSLSAFAQVLTAPKAPTVTVAPIAPVTVQRGKAATFAVNVRIATGFHINSHVPKGDYLIPTALKMNPPSDVMITMVTYPQGEDATFPFAPDQKINVYSGDITINGVVKALSTSGTGTYRVRGALNYQACDNAACYPPKSVPLQFDLKIVRTTAARGRRNPAQSPNVH